MSRKITVIAASLTALKNGRLCPSGVLNFENIEKPDAVSRTSPAETV